MDLLGTQTTQKLLSLLACQATRLQESNGWTVQLLQSTGPPVAAIRA
jgi:hypothetical protein